MSDRSAIEWTDATWNPIRARNKADGRLGSHCEHVSDGCKFCYAERINIKGKAYGTGLPFKPGHRADVDIYLDARVLVKPLHWRKKRAGRLLDGVEHNAFPQVSR